MGAVGCLQAEPWASEGDAFAPNPVWAFPMYLVPMGELLKMDGPPRAHQQLLKEGKVAVWQRGSTCIFISHQWLSYTHPDPEGRQMRVLRSALQNLLLGDLAVEVDVYIEAVTSKSDLPRWGMAEQAIVREAFVWYDYFCIPQVFPDSPSLESIERRTAVGIKDTRVDSGADTVAADMAAAVLSIPIYVGLSQYFLVVAPPLYHYNTKQLCDFESWTKRGWCRVELWSNILRQGCLRPTLLVRSENWVQFVDCKLWFTWQAHKGTLAVESDRNVIKDLMFSMLNRKLNHIGGAARDTYEQWLAAMHGALIGEILPDMDEQDFKDRFRLAGKAKECSMPLVMCAALSGQPHMIRVCLAAGCDVDAPVRRTDLSTIVLMKGFTALQATCYFKPLRHLEVLEVLLEAKADVEARNSWGFRALHCSTYPGAVETLLRYRADINARVVPWGWSVLYCCAAFHGNMDTVEALLRHGARIGHALKSACGSIDDTDMVRCLLKHRADPDRAFTPKLVFKYYGRALSKYHGRELQAASPLIRSTADTDGLTPLGVAAFGGKANVMRALLDARASPDKANWRGLTPRAIAAREGFPLLFAQLAAERAPAATPDEVAIDFTARGSSLPAEDL